jgi:PIN domain nuclease of toxin-antitoxin system
MKLLLDTHIFIWYVRNAPELPDVIRDAIRDPGNEIFLSVVSLWESIIKFQLGKLPLPEPPQTFLPRLRDQHLIHSLLVDEPSVLQLAELPPLHRDPFDRLLICQAIQHGLFIATVDQAFAAYPVPLLSAP